MSKYYDVLLVTEYQDKGGQTKAEFHKIGFLKDLDNSENMTLKIKSLPVNKDWDGWLLVKPQTAKDGDAG